VLEETALTARIALDSYVYEDIYPAFKATTDEKGITADISRKFLNSLADENLVLSGESLATVADIGSGPCDTIVKYLTGVTFAPGFIVRATDFLPEYADSQHGEALKHLSDAQAKKTIKLVGFSARAGDAFGGKLLELVSGPDGASARSVFRIVFASHVMYHADGIADVRRTIADIAGNLLARDGICIMFHLASTAGTFQGYRARFGSETGTSPSDTGAVTIDDPPTQIASVCGELRLPIHQMEFTTVLRFGQLGESEWRAFKDPDSYDALADSNPAAYEDLKRLYFIVQRSPREFATDRSKTGLIQFIDEMRALLDQTGGILPLAERLQVVTRSDAPTSLADAIPRALDSARKLQT
jgi:hypothetical protein